MKGTSYIHYQNVTCFLASGFLIMNHIHSTRSSSAHSCLINWLVRSLEGRTWVTRTGGGSLTTVIFPGVCSLLSVKVLKCRCGCSFNLSHIFMRNCRQIRSMQQLTIEVALKLQILDTAEIWVPNLLFFNFGSGQSLREDHLIGSILFYLYKVN